MWGRRGCGRSSSLYIVKGLWSEVRVAAVSACVRWGCCGYFSVDLPAIHSNLHELDCAPPGERNLATLES
eukprot:3143009-Rhodomonas_salina.2